MNATQKRRLDRASLNVDSVWRDSWDGWAERVVLEWQRLDPQAQAHFAIFQRYEREWVSSGRGGDRAGFLSRGASLCLTWGVSGELWVWLWRDVYGPVLDDDRAAWPRLIPESPQAQVVPSPAQGGEWLLRLSAAVVAVR